MQVSTIRFRKFAERIQNEKILIVSIWLNLTKRTRLKVYETMNTDAIFLAVALPKQYSANTILCVGVSGCFPPSILDSGRSLTLRSGRWDRCKFRRWRSSEWCGCVDDDLGSGRTRKGNFNAQTVGLK